MSSLNSKIVQLDDILLSLSQSIESLNVDAKRTPVHCAPICLQAKLEKPSHHRKGSHDQLQAKPTRRAKEAIDPETDRRTRLALLAKWKAERDAKRAQGQGSFSSISTSHSDRVASPPLSRAEGKLKEHREDGWDYYGEAIEQNAVLYPEPMESIQSMPSHSLQRCDDDSLRILFYFPPFLHSSHFSDASTVSHFSHIAQASPSHFSHFSDYQSPPFSAQIALSTTPVSSCRLFRVGSNWTVGALLDRFAEHQVLVGQASDWTLIERLAPPTTPSSNHSKSMAMTGSQGAGLERRLGSQEYFSDLIEKSQLSHLYFLKMPNENECYARSMACSTYANTPFSFWTQVKILPNGKWKQRWVQLDSNDTISCYKKEKATQGQSLCESIVDAEFYIGPPSKEVKSKAIIGILDASSLTLLTMKNLKLAKDWIAAIQGLKERRMERERILSSASLEEARAAEAKAPFVRSTKEQLIQNRKQMKEKYRASMFTFEDWRRQLSYSTTGASGRLDGSIGPGNGNGSTASLMMPLPPSHLIPMDNRTHSLRASLHDPSSLIFSDSFQAAPMKGSKNVQGASWFRRIFGGSKSKSKFKSNAASVSVSASASASLVPFENDTSEEGEQELAGATMSNSMAVDTRAPRRQGSLTLRTNEPFIQKYESRE